MSRPLSCPRAFEAEAIRDGRLVGAERGSFERHATACSVCAREVHALEALARALRAPDDHWHDTGGGDFGVDELRGQRERTRLLAAFDHALVAPARSWRARIVWPAAVAALAAAGLLLWGGRTALPPPVAVVRGEASAAWSVRREGPREEITLERGSLWIRVDHTAPSARAGRLLVVLPDGELEDTGTIFTVTAARGRTTRVTVAEGSVILRLRGQPPVTIGAGETWPAEAPPAEAPPANLGPPTRVRPRAPARVLPTAPFPAAGPRARLPARPVRTAADVAATGARRPDGVTDPTLDFRAALARFAAGDNRGAAAAFAGFLGRHTQDARAEDAAYLRVIALQRCAAASEMKAAAQDYLRRFPAGFRRAEVAPLAR